MLLNFNSVVVAYLQTERSATGHSLVNLLVICVHSTVEHLLAVSLSVCVVLILANTHAPVRLDRTSTVIAAQVLAFCNCLSFFLNCHMFISDTKVYRISESFHTCKFNIIVRLILMSTLNLH